MMHVIVASSTPTVAHAYVRLVLALVELYGHGPALEATVEVRPIHNQGRLW